jgi:hypothetical protein
VPSPDYVITVRMEVHIPVGVAHVKGMGAEHPGITLLTSPSGCQEPVPGRLTKVRRNTTTGKNYICAYGCAVQGGTVAQEVFAKVYQGTVSASTLSKTPDTGAWGVVPNSSTGKWAFSGDNDLPGAACDQSSGGMANTLALWTMYNGSYSPPEAVLFYGVCSTVTQCGSSTIAAAPPAEFQQWHEHIPDRLVGTLAGASPGLPRTLEFVRESSREEWLCRTTDLGARCVLFRENRRFFLAVEGARPFIFAPRHESAGKPIYLVFEVINPDAGGSGTFQLTITE